MNLHLICILAFGLLLNGSLLMAREIRQERLSLLSETVRLADQETFVLTSTLNHRQAAQAGGEQGGKGNIGRIGDRHGQLGATGRND